MNFILIFILSLLVMNEGVAQTNGTPALKVSDNGHYFLDKNGQPFLWHGDTEWELFRYFTVNVKAGHIEHIWP